MSKAGYDPQGAVALQETFLRLSEGRNSDWLSGLFASHPPSQERVRANIATASTLPTGGRLGVDEFQAAMRPTMKSKPAYDAYDEGRKALSEKNRGEALALANKALDLYADEAHFHALRGDIRLVDDKFDMAITNYNRAVTRRGDFFYYHLQRGLAKNELGQIDGAVIDLNRSIELLPTAPAHFTLGSIAEKRGNIAEALSHYKAVASAGGEYGKAATDAVVKLDLPSNPAPYIPKRCDPDSNGNLVVSVRNDTAMQITGVQIVITITDSSGRTQQRRESIRGQIPPGKVARVSTGLGPYTAGSNCPVTVIAAQIAE